MRTVCPSVNAHIKVDASSSSFDAGHVRHELMRRKPTALSSLVKVLDLAYIVHQGNKSTTARLLNRTKASLQVFIAPQASFAINCWASLSKCTRLRVLDLSLVSECISFASLNQTLRQLPDLRHLCLPRCSSSYGGVSDGMSPKNVRWPSRLEHVSLSGSVSGKFLWDMLREPEAFPPTLSSMAILHCPGLRHNEIQSLLSNLSANLTTVELRDLPAVKQGRFNAVLDWLPNLHTLTIALDYIDTRFGHLPDSWTPSRWREAKPLTSLTLLTSGMLGDLSRAFTPVDLYTLIDERFLGRLRYLYIAKTTGWEDENEGAEVGALETLLVEELDKENWEGRRWHYEGVGSSVPAGWTYERWTAQTGVGRRMRPKLRVLKAR